MCSAIKMDDSANPGAQDLGRRAAGHRRSSAPGVEAGYHRALGRRLMYALFAGGAFALLAVSGGCGRESRGEPGPQTPASAEAVTAEQTVNVEVVETQRETLRELFTLPGSLEAWQDVTVSLEQAGPVRWVGPREGQRLAAGDPIMRIDPETLQAQCDADQVDRDLAERQLRRMELLLEKQLVSELEYDQAREAFEVAKSRLRQSTLALEKSTLRSPIDGVLDELLVDRGEFGAVGSPAAVVVQVDRLKVLVDVPEKDVACLRLGGGVQVALGRVADDRGQTVGGEIVHIAYRADPATRTYRTKVAVSNQSGTLRPGMIVRVAFDRRIHREVVTVPLYSVVDRDGEKEIYVEQGGIARRRPVVAGPVVDGRVVIHDGLVAGERLITAGQQWVRDGTKVRVVADG